MDEGAGCKYNSEGTVKLINMENSSTLQELQEQITRLEFRKANEAIELKQEFKSSLDHLRPINLLKNSIKDISSASDFKDGFLNSTLGLGLGFLTKKALIGTSHNPIKQILGTLLQVGITAVATKNGEGIKTGFSKLLSLFSRNSSKREF